MPWSDRPDRPVRTLRAALALAAAACSSEAGPADVTGAFAALGPVAADHEGVSVAYVLRSPASRPADVSFTVVIGDQERPLTVAGSDGQRDLATSPAGVSHYLLWNAAADLPPEGAEGVRLRAHPVDSASAAPGRAFDSAAFLVLPAGGGGEAEAEAEAEAEGECSSTCEQYASYCEVTSYPCTACPCIESAADCTAVAACAGGGPGEGEAESEAESESESEGEMPCGETVTWAFNETSGFTLYDTTGQFTGFLIGRGGDYVLGEAGPEGFGDAVGFYDGIATFPGVPTMPVELSIEMLVRVDEDGLFLNWRNPDGSGVALGAIGGAVGFFCTDACSGAPLAVGPTIERGEWVHFAFVRFGNTARFYANGIRFWEAATYGTDAFPIENPLFVGTTDGAFRGSIAWLRLSLCELYWDTEIETPAAE